MYLQRECGRPEKRKCDLPLKVLSQLIHGCWVGGPVESKIVPTGGNMQSPTLYQLDEPNMLATNKTDAMKIEMLVTKKDVALS